MPGLILKARGHDIRKGHLGWTFWSPPGLPGGGITGVFPALGVGALMAGSMSGGQMTPVVWSSFSLSVSLVRPAESTPYRPRPVHCSRNCGTRKSAP